MFAAIIVGQMRELVDAVADRAKPARDRRTGTTDPDGDDLPPSACIVCRKELSCRLLFRGRWRAWLAGCAVLFVLSPLRLRWGR